MPPKPKPALIASTQQGTQVRRRRERTPANQGSPGQYAITQTRIPVRRNTTLAVDRLGTPTNRSGSELEDALQRSDRAIRRAETALARPTARDIIDTVRRNLLPVIQADEQLLARFRDGPGMHAIPTRHVDRAGRSHVNVAPTTTPPVRPRPRLDEPDVEEPPDEPRLQPPPHQPRYRSFATQDTQTIQTDFSPATNQSIQTQVQATTETDTQTAPIATTTQTTQTSAIAGMNALASASRAAQGASPETLVSLLEELQRNPQLRQLASAGLLSWNDLLSDRHETLPDGTKVRVVDAKKLLALQQRLSTLAQKEAGKLQNIQQVAVQNRTVPGLKQATPGAIYPGVSVFMYPREMPAGRPGA